MQSPLFSLLEKLDQRLERVILGTVQQNHPTSSLRPPQLPPEIMQTMNWLDEQTTHTLVFPPSPLLSQQFRVWKSEGRVWTIQLKTKDERKGCEYTSYGFIQVTQTFVGDQRRFNTTMTTKTPIKVRVTQRDEDAFELCTQRSHIRSLTELQTCVRNFDPMSRELHTSIERFRIPLAAGMSGHICSTWFGGVDGPSDAEQRRIPKKTDTFVARQVSNWNLEFILNKNGILTRGAMLFNAGTSVRVIGTTNHGNTLIHRNQTFRDIRVAIKYILITYHGPYDVEGIVARITLLQRPSLLKVDAPPLPQSQKFMALVGWLDTPGKRHFNSRLLPAINNTVESKRSVGESWVLRINTVAYGLPYITQAFVKRTSADAVTMWTKTINFCRIYNPYEEFRSFELEFERFNPSMESLAGEAHVFTMPSPMFSTAYTDVRVRIGSQDVIEPIVGMHEALLAFKHDGVILCRVNWNWEFIIERSAVQGAIVFTRQSDAIIFSTATVGTTILHGEKWIPNATAEAITTFLSRYDWARVDIATVVEEQSRAILPNNALGHDPEVVAVVLATEHGATVLGEVRVGGRCLADGLCTYDIRHGRPKKKRSHTCMLSISIIMGSRFLMAWPSSNSVTSIRRRCESNALSGATARRTP